MPRRSGTDPRVAAAVRAQRARMDLALDRVARAPVEDAYEDEADSIVADVARHRGLGRPELAGAAAAFLAARATRLTLRVGRALVDSGGLVMRESLGGLSEFLRRARGLSWTPLDDDATVERIVARRAAQLRSMREATSAAVGARVSESLRARVAEALAVEDAALPEAVGEVLDGAWWQVERAVVTETAFAYNEAQADGMEFLVESDPTEFGGLLMRWTERIDDSGRPLDNRVAADSIAMHAQLAPPGGSFTLPADAARAKIHHSLVGRSWLFPPNRPHDRAVLTPWFPRTGQPGWTWGRDGRRDMS